MILKKRLSELLPQDDLILLHTSPFNNNILKNIRLFFAIYLSLVQIFRYSRMKRSGISQIIYFTNFSMFLTWIYFVLAVQDYYFSKYLKVERRRKFKKIIYSLS